MIFGLRKMQKQRQGKGAMEFAQDWGVVSEYPVFKWTTNRERGRQGREGCTYIGGALLVYFIELFY